MPSQTGSSIEHYEPAVTALLRKMVASKALGHRAKEQRIVGTAVHEELRKERAGPVRANYGRVGCPSTSVRISSTHTATRMSHVWKQHFSAGDILYRERVR